MFLFDLSGNRQVSVDRCQFSTAQDEYMGSQDESQFAQRSHASPAARKLETDEIVKSHQSNQICYDPMAKCIAARDTTAHSDSNAPIASKLVMPDITSDEDDQKDVSSQAADTRQQEVFDKYRDEDSRGIHDVSEEQPTPEESMSTWRMQSQSIFSGFSRAEIELPTTDAAGIDTYIENSKSEYLMSLNVCLGPTWRRSKSRDARLSPVDTDNLKTLGTCRLLSSRLPLHMSGVSSPSTGTLIDSKVPMQGMRASSMKPDCSDSLLLYRKAQRDLARTASSSSMAETVGQDMQSEDLAFPHDDDFLPHSTSTEHRWGSGGQAMTRNKRISKVVRPQSTPPVMPSLSLFINERPFSWSSSSRQWSAASPGTSASQSHKSECVTLTGDMLDLTSNPNRRSPRRAHSSLESCARQGKEECEIFGGHFEWDPETKRGICVGVAAHHAPDYHRSYSFETNLGRSARRPGRTNKSINEAGYDDVFTGSASPVDAPAFSRPCSRQLDRSREDASRQLADVILIGRGRTSQIQGFCGSIINMKYESEYVQSVR